MRWAFMGVYATVEWDTDTSDRPFEKHNDGLTTSSLKDKGGVVDERLRVYDVGNLRVVDASVFPMIPRGNIQSSVYAVAERAADFIRVR